MQRAILDASALLCVLFEERGMDTVASVLAGAMIGSVNFSEVVAKIVDKGMDVDRALGIIARMKLEIVPFDVAQAEAAGRLRAVTRDAGLSLGDRSCLALAMSRQGRAITTDRSWAQIADAAGVTVELAR